MNTEKRTFIQKFNSLLEKMGFKFETVKTKEGDLELLDGIYSKDGVPANGDYTLIMEDGSEKLVSLKDGKEVAIAEIPVAASEDIEIVAPESDVQSQILDALSQIMIRIKALEDKGSQSEMVMSKKIEEMESKFSIVAKPVTEKVKTVEEFSKLDNPFKRKSNSVESSFSKMENPFKK